MSQVEQRVFLVGCPRSGTTLLQGMLAAHPDICSVPETHFFVQAYPRNRLKRALTWPALNVAPHLRRLVSEMGRDDLRDLVRLSPFAREFHVPFVRLLDHLAEEAGCRVWLEKTPRHLHCIEQIAQRVPGARFLHLVRNGADTIASLYRATNDNPHAWGRLARFRRFRGFSLDECIERWLGDIAISRRHEKSPGHLVCRYEDLVRQPATELELICAFLGVDVVPELLHSQRSFEAIVRPEEAWKARNAGPLEVRIGTAGMVLDPEQLDYVRARLDGTGGAGAASWPADAP